MNSTEDVRTSEEPRRGTLAVLRNAIAASVLRRGGSVAGAADVHRGLDACRIGARRGVCSAYGLEWAVRALLRDLADPLLDNDARIALQAFADARVTRLDGAPLDDETSDTGTPDPVRITARGRAVLLVSHEL